MIGLRKLGDGRWEIKEGGSVDQIRGKVFASSQALDEEASLMMAVANEKRTVICGSRSSGFLPVLPPTSGLGRLILIKMANEMKTLG